ncbi:MFS transporter [Streptomyces sp. NPDC006265]|uniref:MFS transporter n=1 Tax=Streptomyces sp. NPDC006265 TaxID=3156740 RepID=UPI0033A3AB5B
MIVLRAVQGGLAAFLQPATLALLRLAYPADRLGKPIAIRTSALAVAAGSGPLLGGVLVAHLGWRAVLWVNVPLAFVIAVLALAVWTPAPQRVNSPRLNLTSAGLLAVALAILVHALADIPARGVGRPRRRCSNSSPSSAPQPCLPGTNAAPHTRSFHQS